MIRSSLFLCLLFSQLAFSEYRVFELEITTYAEEEKPDPSAVTTATQAQDTKKIPEAIDSKIVISNLDPEQYRGYYNVQKNQNVRYISTWKCPGRTANKDYCPNPKVKTEDISSAVPLENK